MKDIFILGAGGHAKVIINCLHEQSIAVRGLIDSNPEKHHQQILNVPVLGSEEILQQFSPENIWLINGVGSVGNPEIRSNLFHYFEKKGYRFTNVIHPSAVVARDVNLQAGAVIMAGAIIQPGTYLGKNVIVNTMAAIDHDCIIGDNVHIAPSATLCGNVTIGYNTHIGCGARIIQGKKIGNHCIIAAGAVVVNDVADNSTIRGVPGKVC